MRKIQFILFLLFSGYLVSCEQSEFGSEEILGEWITVFHCDSCYIFDFKPNHDLLVNYIGEDEKIVFWYNIKKDDTISIGDGAKTTNYPLIFHSYDSLEIKNFKVIDAFQAKSTFLKRIEK